MRTAYSVETVRAAERELMARLPEGALDAAGGGRTGRGLRGVAGAGVRQPGRAAGRQRRQRRRRAVRRGPAGPPRRRVSWPCCSRPTGRTTPAGSRPCAAPAARGARSGRGGGPIRRADLVVDGIVGHRRQGRSAPGRRAARGLAASPAPPSWPSTCPAASRPTPAKCAGAAVRADATVTFGTHKPGLLVDPAREYAGSAAARRHRARRCPSEAGWRRCSTPTWRRCCPCRGPRATSTGAGSWASWPGPPAIPARPCWPSPGPCGAGPAPCGTSGPPGTR